MAGGPWNVATIGQGRPGLFINFVPAAIAAIAPGASGVTIGAVKAPWGPDNAITTCDNEVDLLNYFTTSDTSPYNAWYEGHHAFLGGAQQVKLYRIEGAGAAKSTLAVVDSAAAAIFTLNGKYNGVRGNTFKFALLVNALDATKTDVMVYIGTVLQVTYTTSQFARGVAGHIQEICNLINNDTNNYLVTAVFTAEGTSIPATLAIPGTAMAGGNDGAAPLMADYVIAMAAIELQQFNVYHTDVLESDIAGIGAATAAWVRGMRGYGKYVTWVTGSAAAEALATAQSNAAAYNSEFAHYVYPGVYELNSLGQRTLRRGAAYAATLAGMIASLIPGDSLTYAILPNLLDLEVRLSNANIKAALATGLLVLTFDGLQFKIEEDINTLVTFNANQTAEWQGIDVINTMDAIATGITVSGNANYIGKIPNDAVGQAALLNAVRDFLRAMASQRAILPNFIVVLDPNRVSSGKDVFIAIAMQVTQAMKFIYFTVTVG
jgi:hypothetical protein